MIDEKRKANAIQHQCGFEQHLKTYTSIFLQFNRQKAKNIQMTANIIYFIISLINRHYLFHHILINRHYLFQ